MSIRAVRNNNPGNLNAGDQWQGLQPQSDMTPAQAGEKRFAVFAAPKWGFRALATVLLNYERRHGLNTIRQIITRWAPPGENNTESYIKAVCAGVGADPGTKLDLHNTAVLQSLAKAISIHECGGWFFNQGDLTAGVKLAEGE